MAVPSGRSIQGVAAVAETFRRAHDEGRAALIPFFTAGYPSLAVLPELLRAAEDAGADLVEVGIPFSDPLADGPMLQKAAATALAGGVRVDAILDILARTKTEIPRVFLTYVNPVLRRGFDRFADNAVASGMAGAIVPDLPWTEARALRRAFSARGLAVIPLVAPTSTDAHLAALRSADGFVYAVSVTGVTGARQSVAGDLETLVARIRQAVPLPVAVGFGIATPEHAQAIGQFADGVIVGSALTEAIMRRPQAPAEATYAFLRPMAEALARARGD